MRMIGAMLVMVALFGALLVPAAEGTVYYADKYLSVEFKIDKSIIKPKFVPGGVFDLDVYITNNINVTLNPYKGFAVISYYWKIDWMQDWKGSPHVSDFVVIWPNETVCFRPLHIEIPDNVTVGPHSLVIKIIFYLYGDGWGIDEGSDTTWLYGWYNFTIEPVNTSSSDTTSESGISPLLIGGIVGSAIAAVVVVAVVLWRKKR